MSRKVAVRASIIGLLLGVAPVASAIGQPAGTDQAAVAAPLDFFSVARSHLDEAAARIEAERQTAAALEQRAAGLRPGEFIWQPEAATEGEVEIVVSIAAQKAYVYRADTLIGVTTVSTGARGHRTPTGTFTILQKARRHFSSTYNNAPMPNMQRLTWRGIALHAGALPGYPASHGCIRLPMEFSRELFGVTRLGGRVHIVAGTPPSAADALAFATGRGGGLRMASAR